MKRILKSIFRMRLIALLMIAQFAFSLALVNTTTLLNHFTVSKNKKLSQIFDIGNTYLIRVQGVQQGDMREYSFLSEVASSIESLKNENKISNAYTYGWAPPFDITGHINYSTMDRVLTAGLIVDKGFADRYDIEVEEGRSFKKEDFTLDYKKDAVPILLGSDYRGKIDLGHKFTINSVQNQDLNVNMTMDDITFEVVGFLKPNELVTINTKTNLSKGTNFSNMLMVFPSVDNFFAYNRGINLGDFGMFVELREGQTIEEVTKEINKVLESYSEKYGIKLGINTTLALKSEFNPLSEAIDRDSSITKILSVILTILSAIGVTSTMLGELQRRKKEFGVRLSQGASPKRLCREIFSEILTISLISVVVSFILAGYMNGEFFMSKELLAINVAYVVGLSVIMSIVPILKIRKMNVVELIRGK